MRRKGEKEGQGEEESEEKREKGGGEEGEEEGEEEKEEGEERTSPPTPDCPICYEPMTPPTRIFQCGAGHLVCGACKPKLQVFHLLHPSFVEENKLIQNEKFL